MKYPALVKTLLDQPNSCLIGSRALNLEHCRDYDIAIANSDYINDLIPKADLLLDMKKYFACSPLGNNLLLKFEKEGIDVLVYEDPQSIEDLKDCISTLKTVPTVFLEKKNIRITLFEHLLKLKNWQCY